MADPQAWRQARITLSLAPNKFGNGTNISATTDEVVNAYFAHHLIRPHKDFEGFSCELVNDTPLSKGKNLRNANARAWPFIVYDLDKNQPYEDAIRKLRQDEIAFIGYSSFSHQLAKDGAPPIAKFRIVILIDAPYVLAAEDEDEAKLRTEVYKRVYIWLGDRYGFVWDQQCKNTARFFYFPMHNGAPESTAHAFIDLENYRTGTPLNFTELAEKVRAEILVEREQAEAKKKEKAERRANSEERAKIYQTPELAEFKERCGASLDVKAFFLDHSDEAKQSATGAVEAVCPNQHAHTGGADNRLTCFVFNAGDPDGNGGAHSSPFVGCNHDTCAKDLKPWDYIDLTLSDLSLGVQDLLAYVPENARARFEVNRGLPRGYARVGGRITGTTNGERPTTLDLCKDFVVGPRVHDENGTGWGTEITFKNESGADVTLVILKRELQQNEPELRARLSDFGLDVSTLQAAKPMIIDCLNRLRPDGVRHNYTRPGWHDTAFVSAMGEVIAVGDKPGLTGRLDPQRSASVRKPSGSGEAFNKDVLGKLDHIGLCHFQLGIFVGCAGPLMKLLNLESRIIYFGGASKRGKTTTQELSVSIWASPERGKGLLFACKATLNGLEALLARGRDQTTALDELRQMEERARTNLVFDLAAGSGKARMTKNLEMQRTISWDSQIITLSGEQSVGQLLGKTGRVAGEVVRMPSLDVGTLKAHPDPRYVKSIGQAARDNFGWLGPDVVRTIIKLGYRDDPDKLRAIYEAKHDLLVTSNAATHHEAASVFALLWTTGALLQTVGLVPEQWNIERSVRWAYDTFNAGTDALRLNPLQAALDALLEHIASNPTRFPFADKGTDQREAYVEADGWRALKSPGLVFMKASAFDRIVGEHTNPLSCKQWLAATNILIKKGDRDYTHASVPDVGHIKNVRLMLPRAELDADGSASADTFGTRSDHPKSKFFQ